MLTVYYKGFLKLGIECQKKKFKGHSEGLISKNLSFCSPWEILWDIEQCQYL